MKSRGKEKKNNIYHKRNAFRFFFDECFFVFFLENLKFASEGIYKFLLTTFVQKTLNLILQKL